MKKLVVSLFAGVMTLAAIQNTKADLIAGWDFSTLVSATLNPTSISSTVGTATLDLTGFTQSENTNFAGSTLNTFTGGSVTAGQALAIVNSSANGKSMLFTFSLLGYQDLIVTFAGRGTGTGFNSGAWSWSTDNITYTTLAGVNTATTSTTFAVQTADFTAEDGFDNATTAYLKYTLSGATSASGNNRIDNIQFNATVTSVPEPSTFALATLGGIACLFAVRRKR